MRNHLAVCPYLSGNCLNCQSSLTRNILFFSRFGGFTAGGEYFRSHIAAGFGPFVVLLGQHGADEADDGVTAGEDPDDVGPPPDLLIQPLLYPALTLGARQSCCRCSAFEAGEVVGEASMTRRWRAASLSQPRD